jgi:hypothetical protein
LTANPRTSRGRSPEPAPPATVEKRANTSVFFFGSCRNAALVSRASDFVG